MLSENFGRTVGDATSTIIATIGIGLFVVLCLACLAGTVLVIVGRCKLFTKCGQEGWKAIIPFYGEYVFLEKICGLHWGWFVAYAAVTFLSFEATTVTFVKLIINAFAFYNLAIKCNKDKTESLIFGALFPGVVATIYGLGKAEYHPENEVKQSALF